MIYHIVKYLNDIGIQFSGQNLFYFISFRAALAFIISLIVTIVFGKNIIEFLRKKQIGESIRDLGLEGQLEKKGTPTMGGFIILLGILVPVLLLCKLNNVYTLLMIFVTVAFAAIGFLDDYIKKFKKDKEGLPGRKKIIGQVIIGLIVGIVLYVSPDVKIKRELVDTMRVVSSDKAATQIDMTKNLSAGFVDAKGPITTIPFVKSHELNYGKLLSPFTDNYMKYAWIIFIPIVIFILTAVSNGANITDGIDGLAGGTSAIISLVLLVFAYVSGNVLFAKYLNVMYIPLTSELVIYCAALTGSCIGFLWYNTYPASVFMGDTGSLALGGIVGTLAVILRKELMIPIFCGIFLVENLSVMLQVAYFKYTKKKFGEGRRIFLMSPLHHHYQKKGYHESKIVMRFLIVGILLAMTTLITLKLR